MTGAIVTASIASPIGTLLLAWRGEALVSLDYAGYEERFERLLARRYGRGERRCETVPNVLREPLEAYFAGALNAVDAMAVEYCGSAFENGVWRALRTIAPGKTASYGELAARVGRPKAARAVGRANSMNPVAIVVPCHRVIGANAKLTGYAGGLERKEWLLRHELQRVT